MVKRLLPDSSEGSGEAISHVVREGRMVPKKEK